MCVVCVVRQIAFSTSRQIAFSTYLTSGERFVFVRPSVENECGKKWVCKGGGRQTEREKKKATRVVGYLL